MRICSAARGAYDIDMQINLFIPNHVENNKNKLG